MCRNPDILGFQKGDKVGATALLHHVTSQKTRHGEGQSPPVARETGDDHRQSGRLGSGGLVARIRHRGGSGMAKMVRITQLTAAEAQFPAPTGTL
jgi:hypothetical protein